MWPPSIKATTVMWTLQNYTKWYFSLYWTPVIWPPLLCGQKALQKEWPHNKGFTVSQLFITSISKWSPGVSSGEYNTTMLSNSLWITCLIVTAIMMFSVNLNSYLWLEENGNVPLRRKKSNLFIAAQPPHVQVKAPPPISCKCTFFPSII